MLLCVWGITKIDTNYLIKESLPKNSAIAEDFKFFQQNYSGFRPLEVPVIAQNGHKVTDFEVAQEIEKVEQQLKAQPAIRNLQSVNTLYKAINKAHNLNGAAYFILPKDLATFESFKKEVKKLARKQYGKFVNTKETKARITARVLDVGTDTLNKTYERFNAFTRTQTDTSIVKFRLTGSGVLLDKN